MQINITNLTDLSSFISSNKFTVVYFSTPDCNVCKVLKPKLIAFLEDFYPDFKYAYVDISIALELSAQKNVFTVPTILFFIEGKEQIRKTRFINFDELNLELVRYLQHYD